MGWCAACNTKIPKGVKACSFPKSDPVRKEIWIKNLNKEDWTPSKTATICEKHFAPEMWEKVREDGKKKLKANAIPTIFSRISSYNEPTIATNNVDAVPTNEEIPVDELPLQDVTSNIDAPSKESDHKIVENEKGSSDSEVIDTEQLEINIPEKKPSYEELWDQLQKAKKKLFFNHCMVWFYRVYHHKPILQLYLKLNSNQ
ncbi:PREDICTED: THAP domain-containing protein 5-like [Wasmannia auropunctata]|uniref:THAP domain-containing protein 5-like n=1 Tax=Wasmannia auropunctata TaxID=64793 RepID=UPI0005ED77D3|nr:PREDICTED: THAP domain-containing protein 5-like [Wasmannia auropunctata]